MNQILLALAANNGLLRFRYACTVTYTCVGVLIIRYFGFADLAVRYALANWATYLRKISLILASLFVASVAFAQTDQEIDTFTLKNGMQVILIPNHRVPVVTHMMWYKVGAGDDFPGRSGLAHYNEHMMFKGTKKVPAGQFASIINNDGGQFNAFTSWDYTGYYVSIAKEHLPQVMELEADRMLNLAPTQENFNKEREVIIEERRMSIENEPSALLGEEMRAQMYRNHPYHNPVIGWMHEMKALSREDVLAFHHAFYHPANAVLVVAGDVTQADLKKLAEKYYGSLPAGDANIRHWRTEPPQRGPRHITMHHENVKEPEFTRYYVAPSAGEGDHALMVPSFVLAQLLGGGTTSRMYQSLVVNQKVATSVDVDYDGISIGPAMLEVRATPAQGVTLEQLEAAIDKEINATLTDAVTPDDLTRTKVLLKADTIYARDSMESMARVVGELRMAGLPVDYFNAWPTLVGNVTADDVHKAALAIFKPEASVTGYLLPKKESAQ